MDENGRKEKGMGGGGGVILNRRSSDSEQWARRKMGQGDGVGQSEVRRRGAVDKSDVPQWKR